MCLSDKPTSIKNLRPNGGSQHNFHTTKLSTNILSLSEIKAFCYPVRTVPGGYCSYCGHHKHTGNSCKKCGCRA